MIAINISQFWRDTFV